MFQQVSAKMEYSFPRIAGFQMVLEYLEHLVECRVGR